MDCDPPIGQEVSYLTRHDESRWIIPTRAHGERQPGIDWGPFTLRIPFYHFRAEWPEMIQGLVVAGATGLALIPILTRYFHVSFDVALAIVIVQSVLIANAPTWFGDPYCHGWVTPAIPLVILEMIRLGAGADASPEVTREVIHLITAFTLTCAAIFFVAGISGLGRVIVERTPLPLKAGIIFGAAISAFNQEFRVYREGTAPPHSYLFEAPYSCLTAVAICLILMFSVPVARWRVRYGWVKTLVGLGLAPGFAVAMLVGWLSGELEFAVQWGIERPPFGEMWRTLSPLSIGFPSLEMFATVLPLAIVVYVIGFGDIVTANEMLRDASVSRPDERIDINPTRAHLNIGIRNALQAIISGPFPVTHGPLWTGVHVVVTERYKQGRDAMDSIYGGISAYYFWGLPILLFFKPVTSLLRPMLPVALSMTILLTGFACGYLAMVLPRNNIERGVALTTGMVLALFGAWQALVLGLVMTVVMCGWESIFGEYTEVGAAARAATAKADRAPSSTS